MKVLIDFIAPLTPAQTGAFALALVTAVVLLPYFMQWLVNALKAMAELMDTTEDEAYMEWMDAEKWQAEREEMQQDESIHKSMRRVCREAGQDISAARGHKTRTAFRAVQPVQQVGGHKPIQL